MAELNFEELLRNLQDGLGEKPVEGGRITPAQLADAEAKAAARAALNAANQVDRTKGVSAAQEYLSKGKKVVSAGAKRVGVRGLLRGAGPVGAGLLINEALQGALKLGVNYFNPERPKFIPPEVHKQIMDRLGTVDPGRDSFLQKNRFGEPDLPVQIDSGSIKFPNLKGSIPSSQPVPGVGPAARRPVNLSAIDNPDIPVVRGTGVIRNNRTGRVFGVDGRDTVNHQFDGVDTGDGLALPRTGFKDIDQAMPGIVNAAIAEGRANRERAVTAAHAKEVYDFNKSAALERLKQLAPTTKVLEPSLPGGVPQVVTVTPGQGATVQAALPPGQDLQSLDAAHKDLLKRRPDLLGKINSDRTSKYNLPPIALE